MADSFPTSAHLAANLIQTGYKYRRPLGYYLAATAAYKTGKYIYDSMAPYMYKGRKRRMSYGSSRPMKKRRTYKRQPARGTGVTQQYNRSSQYRYKRMPRYKKKAYVRKVKTINHVINKSLGTQSVVFNTGASYSSDNINQAYGTFLLYGQNGSPDPANVGMDDLFRIFQNIDSSNFSQFKIRFETAILDFTLTNVSTGDFPKLEVDIYELYFYQETGNNSFSTAITTAQANTTNINPLGTGVNLANRGCTLFELPALGQMMRYKIVKKTKYFVDYGQCITYQMRDARNYEVDRLDVLDTSGFVKEKMTKGIFVVSKLVPGNGVEAQARISYGCTRAYHYVVNQKNSVNDQFNP